ncbi:MAG: hypothetical protein KAS95_04195 [Candidatus Heimdallarchaeota archaeon]|nr:hypothetical protein [Candidatus Heimdallarchaeota archaeon]
MSVVSEFQVGQLGGYISSTDLSQILSSGIRKQRIVKSYFSNPEDERINRIMTFTHQIGNLLIEYFPSTIITEVTIHFQRLVPLFLEDYGDCRYFTRLHVANHFLALLDYRLSLVGSKLSPKHIDLISQNLDYQRGKTKTFSFFAMKKVQNDLLTAGFIQRKRKMIYSPLLSSKVNQAICGLEQAFPHLEDLWSRVREESLRLISLQFVPKINIDDCAIVILATLIPFYCVKERGLMKVIWMYLEHHYNIDIDYIKRKVYRFRSMLRKNLKIE